MNEPYTDENLKLANELKTRVEKWVSNESQAVHLEVYETMAAKEGDHLCSFIASIPVTESDLDDYDLLEKYQEEDHYDRGPEEFLQDENCEAYEELQGENYPMWNTIFHFGQMPDDFAKKAQEAGIGVIEDVPGFDGVSLFFRGCGYSFYGSHWIPLYLSFFAEYNDFSKYKNVNLQGV